MNTNTIKGNWNLIKGKLKQKYAQLTDNDLIYVEGKEDELLGGIQKKTGRSRAEIERFLDEDCGCYSTDPEEFSSEQFEQKEARRTSLAKDRK